MLRSRKFEKLKKKTIRRRLIIFVLVYLIFITAYLSVNTLSKYVGISSGSGNIQVAKWEVSAISDSEDTMNIIAENTTAAYEVKISSTSEVGCTYSILIENVPDGVKIKIDDESAIAPSDGTITFENCGHFDANSQGTVLTHTLTVEADVSAGEINDEELNVDITFIQDNI